MSGLRRAGPPVEGTRLSVRDALGEASAAILSRPGRAGLTALGTLLGVAAFVAVLGLTATASGQISTRFTPLVATQLVVEDAADDPAVGWAFPADTDERLAALNGVRHAGLVWKPSIASTGEGGVAVATGPPTTASESAPLPVLAASPGYFGAARAHLRTGRLYDAFHESERQHVAVLGSGAAKQLGITQVSTQPAIFINGTAFTVIGIVDHVDRAPETLLSVIVPSSTAMHVWGPPRAGPLPPTLLIETELGAAKLVASQVALAIRPEEPERFRAVVPPDPRTLKDKVDTDLSTLFLGLAVICLVIGALGIANTSLVSVLERIGEIGLRRALGARRRHVATQFLLESAMLGLVGGLVGTSVGVCAVVGVSAVKSWTPILEPIAVFPAPLVGAATGLLAGLYPSWRASRVEPVEALRR